MSGLVLQCGGPTAVVNTTLAALVRRWEAVRNGTPLFGGRYGLAALATGDWVPLTDTDAGRFEWIETSPGMALGGGRDRLTDAAIDSAIRLLGSRGVDTLFVIGGNGSMAAARALHAHGVRARTGLRVAGLPKTIDNDIPGTDLCPGFPSAARFVADTVRDIAADVDSMRGYEDVVLVEVMGRHTGWLAASSLAWRSDPADAPHLVLVPETPVSDDAFVEAVREIHARAGVCVVTVAEGVRDVAGTFLAAKGCTGEVERDASGQIILGRSGGPLPYLARLVREGLGLKCRQVRPDVLQRCSRAHVTPLDRRLAALVGTAAVDYHGETPVMIALSERGQLGWTARPLPLEAVCGERTLPDAPERVLDWLRRVIEA